MLPLAVASVKYPYDHTILGIWIVPLPGKYSYSVRYPMINTSEFYFPDPNNHGDRIRLFKPISAIQLVQAEDGGAKLGVISQLGPGTTVEICGSGFNERTVKVRSASQYYFVFLQDLNLQKATTAG